jgi:hypothetical protein
MTRHDAFSRVFTRSRLAKKVGEALLIAATLVFAGCAGRASLLPNPDPAMRKTEAQFAAQSARLRYEADAPHVQDPDARAEVDYTFKEIHLTNLSNEDWRNVEVWVNQKYACIVPRVPKSTSAHPYMEQLNFQLLFDRDGNSLPLTGVTVKKVEITRGGTVYEIPLHLAD